MCHTVADVQHNAGHQTLCIEREEHLNGNVSSVKIVFLEHGLVDTLSILKVWREMDSG